MEKISLVIADDHAVVREGTRNLLNAEPDMEVIGEADDGEKAVEMAVKLMPDVVLMDIAMPKMDGIAATKQIKEQCPSINVLILSAYDNDQFIFKLLQVGAAGYLLKSVHGKELVDVVRAIYHGESVLHPAIARKVMERFSNTSAKPRGENPTGSLSARDIEFLKLLTKGLSNKEMASELSISLRTVQGQLRQIFKKLGVSSRTEAVVLALKEKLVSLEDMAHNDPAAMSAKKT